MQNYPNFTPGLFNNNGNMMGTQNFSVDGMVVSGQKWTEILKDIICPNIMNLIYTWVAHAFKHAKANPDQYKVGQMNKYAISTLQNWLHNIKDWSPDEIKKYTQRVRSCYKGDLKVLINKVLKSNLQILSLQRTGSDDIIGYTPISDFQFVHRCFIQCGQFAKINTFLFVKYENIIANQKYANMAKGQIRNVIDKVIQSFLPIEQLDDNSKFDPQKNNQRLQMFNQELQKMYLQQQQTPYFQTQQPIPMQQMFQSNNNNNNNNNSKKSSAKKSSHKKKSSGKKFIIPKGNKKTTSKKEQQEEKKKIVIESDDESFEDDSNNEESFSTDEYENSDEEKSDKELLEEINSSPSNSDDSDWSSASPTPKSKRRQKELLKSKNIKVNTVDKTKTPKPSSESTVMKTVKNETVSGAQMQLSTKEEKNTKESETTKIDEFNSPKNKEFYSQEKTTSSTPLKSALKKTYSNSSLNSIDSTTSKDSALKEKTPTPKKLYIRKGSVTTPEKTLSSSKRKNKNSIIAETSNSTIMMKNESVNAMPTIFTKNPFANIPVTPFNKRDSLSLEFDNHEKNQISKKTDNELDQITNLYKSQ